MERMSKISLIDLTSQLPFEIDDAVKKEICFGEALIISCGHYEGEVGADESDSEWSCHDSTSTEVIVEIKKDEPFEVKDRVEEEAELEQEEEDDFHFYFFPDCNKPTVQQSKDSLIIVDGLPQVNPKAKEKDLCMCLKDTKGRCDCYTKLPCKCGAKTTAECTCSKLETICICDELKPRPVCMCKGVCVCFPGLPRPVCTCDKVEKPCICYEKAGKFPNPVCVCTRKPKYGENPDLWTGKFKTIEEEGEQAMEEEENEEGSEGEQKEEGQEVIDENICSCQVVPKKPKCLCLKDKEKECVCKADACICGVQNTCLCEPSISDPHICKSDESHTVCECAKKPATCTCEGDTYDCKCFPHDVCTCGDPENCKCFLTCDCKDPCICDVVAEKEPECTCLDKSKDGEAAVCTCDKEKERRDEIRKLKKVRAGKDGFRWCRDVDPRHTYFDYGYDRHDLISKKEKLRDKVTILGSHDEVKQEEECPVHGVKAPPYKKTVRKPSIDCCSSVGGISICVETLGEDKDKFLVQVVSHSSKEGAKSGTKLVSIIDCNLHTMEENRTEHITKENLTKERKSYIAICESGYYNKITRTCGDRSVVQRRYHSFADSREFLLEGANVVLLRYFGLRRYRGNVKTDTVMMNGSICESIYVCNGVSQAIVNGKPLFVVKVERHIIEPSGFVHQCLTVLSLKGYMISHEWADNNYIFHINPLLNVVPERDEIEPHAPMRERWREDMQLLSDYLDFKMVRHLTTRSSKPILTQATLCGRKRNMPILEWDWLSNKAAVIHGKVPGNRFLLSTRTSEGGRYVTESGALTATIRDYLQAVLLLRPHDALHFTRHYFSSTLSALDLPHDEYFDPTSKHVRYYFFEE